MTLVTSNRMGWAELIWRRCTATDDDHANNSHTGNDTNGNGNANGNGHTASNNGHSVAG